MTGPSREVPPVAPSAGGHHRRPARRGRYLRWAGSAAMIVVTVVAGGAIRTYTPDTDRRERPFVRTGGEDSPVSARTFDVTVLGVRGGAKVSRAGKDHDTGGVWVIVRVRLVGRTAPANVGYAAVADARDRRYHATGRFIQPLPGGRTLQPDIPLVAEIAFEVPAPVDMPLYLLLAGNSLDQRMDAMARCRLPVDEQALQRWRAESEPLTIAAPEVAA